MCEFECGVAVDQWVPNVSEVRLGVLIIDFVRWLYGPWVAFGHWRTYLIAKWLWATSTHKPRAVTVIL
jgi:hypothetical protein